MNFSFINMLKIHTALIQNIIDINAIWNKNIQLK